MLTANRKLKALQYLAGIAIIFVIVAFKASVEVAAWFVICGVIGYLNAFYVVRLLISLIGRKKSSRTGMVIAIGSIAVSAAIVYFGYGLVLSLTTACFVFIDAVVLRFK
jgi:hypothetical protein